MLVSKFNNSFIVILTANKGIFMSDIQCMWLDGLVVDCSVNGPRFEPNGVPFLFHLFA